MNTLKGFVYFIAVKDIPGITFSFGKYHVAFLSSVFWVTVNASGGYGIIKATGK